jgi:hypothetical protein
LLKGYAVFAALVALLFLADFIFFPGSVVWRISRSPGLSLEWLGTSGQMLYALILPAAVAWVSRTVTQQVWRFDRDPSGEEPVLRSALKGRSPKYSAVAAAGTAAKILWVVFLVFLAKDLWLWLFHLEAVIDAAQTLAIVWLNARDQAEPIG